MATAPPPLPASPAPHQRMSADDRRRQLLETAIDLFSRKGFAGTTTREIATAAGVNEAIIFRHFATKQDLYKAILDHKCGGDCAGNAFSEVDAAMAADDDEAFFRALITRIIAFHREDPRFERLLMHAALEGHELAILHHNQTKLPIGQKLTAYIARRQAAGALRPGDPMLFLFALAGLPHFYALQKYVYQSGDLPFTDEQVVSSFVRIIMDGLSNSGNTSPGEKQ